MEQKLTILLRSETEIAFARLVHIVLGETLGILILITAPLWPLLHYVRGLGPQMAQNLYYGSVSGFWALFFLSVQMIRVGLTFGWHPSLLANQSQRKDPAAKYYVLAIYLSLYLIISFLGCRAVGMFGHHIKGASPFLLQGLTLITFVMFIMIVEQLAAKRRKQHLLAGIMFMYLGLILLLSTILLPFRAAIIP